MKFLSEALRPLRFIFLWIANFQIPKSMVQVLNTDFSNGFVFFYSCLVRALIKNTNVKKIDIFLHCKFIMLRFSHFFNIKFKPLRFSPSEKISISLKK